jgi:hypothetical protein
MITLLEQIAEAQRERCVLSPPGSRGDRPYAAAAGGGLAAALAVRDSRLVSQRVAYVAGYLGLQALLRVNLRLATTACLSNAYDGL